jgi:hypothetical protein
MSDYAQGLAGMRKDSEPQNRHRGGGQVMPDRPVFLTRLALPVAWEALAGPPSAEDCGRAASANIGVVGLLLRGANLDAVPRPADEALTEALAPLRIKLDTIVDMLGRLTYRDVALPPVRDIELGAGRLAWHSPGPLRAGDWLRIQLYFDAKILEPIILYGRIESALHDDGGCGIQAELTELSAQAEEDFARLAFLAQRRQLAQRSADAAWAER